MNAPRKFIFLELNEVPLRVFSRYAEDHPNSAMATLLNRGRRWDTLSVDKGHLSPWITWPTIHRGVSNEQHHISTLGQDISYANEHFPPVWEILSRAGRKVGMFGSLHTYPLPDDLSSYAFYMPDTFAAGPEAYPEELSMFQEFNLGMVDRSGRNVSNEVPVKQAFKFLRDAFKLGLRAGTVAKVARQLASERVVPHRAVRRRTIQSMLSFDLFLHQLVGKRPDAAFFFTNHVASSMHRYWPAMFSGDYKKIAWKKDWVDRFAGEIDYSMGEADNMLADLIAFADRNPDYLIFVSGSMGQAAVDEPETQTVTEVLLKDTAKLVSALGISGAWDRKRTMEPAYTLVFDRTEDAQAFEDKVGQMVVGGEKIKPTRLDERSVEFMLGQPNVPNEGFAIIVGNESFAPAELGIENTHIQDEVGSAAYHVPEGCLLSYDPQWRGGAWVGPEEVATTRVAPTLLALAGVRPPSYMQAPIAELVETVDA